MVAGHMCSPAIAVRSRSDILESMFDNRRWHVWRPFSPPRPVYVDVDRVLSADLPDSRAVPSGVRKHGLVLRGRMPAEQRAWYRLIDGRWIASLQLPVQDGDGWIYLDMIVPADAVAPRDDGTTFPTRPSDQWGQPRRY